MYNVQFDVLTVTVCHIEWRASKKFYSLSPRMFQQETDDFAVKMIFSVKIGKEQNYNSKIF